MAYIVIPSIFSNGTIENFSLASEENKILGRHHATCMYKNKEVKMHHPDFYQLTEKYFKAYLLVCVNLIEIPRRNYLVMEILHCSKIYGKHFL